jgi:hypothetical protein
MNDNCYNEGINITRLILSTLTFLYSIHNNST